MHFTLSCEVHHSRIVLFGQLKNGDRRVLFGYWYLCIFHAWFWHRNQVVLRYTGIGVWLKNNRVMLLKLWTKDTRARNQITCKDHHSWVGLGPIHPHRVYPYHISFLELCFYLFSIKNGQWATGNVWRIQWQRCMLCRMVWDHQEFSEASFCWWSSLSELPMQ
jgi:hypothetical protein